MTLKLQKALPQDRYIKIVSTNIGNPTIADRDFGGLIFTETTDIYTYNPATKEWEATTFTADMMIEVYSSDQAAKYFGSGSREAEMARRYFSYRSPSGYSPRRLCFVWKDPAKAPVDALRDLDGMTNNFGGFMFAQWNDITCKQVKDVIAKVHELDHKYLFAVPIAYENQGGVGDNYKMAEVEPTSFQGYLAGGDGPSDYSGYCIWIGTNKPYDETEGTYVDESDSDASDVEYEELAEYAAMMPLAVLGAIRYSRVNTVTNFMFKRFPGQPYTVDEEDLANIYDTFCINYIGLVQANGPRKAFSQQGFNGNGEATNTYCNEMWLKSEISTALLNLFLETEVVSADDDGEALIFNTIAAVVVTAKNNGAISVGKTLDEDQKNAIYRLTQDPEAWKVIQDSGYTLTVSMERVQESGRTYYKALYRLVYSKDDAILKVEGQHALV